MADISKRIERFKRIVPSVIKEYGFELIDNELNKSMREVFERKNNNPFSSYNSSKITKRSGALIDSYKTNNPNTASFVKYSGNQLKTNFGSNLIYASIHETGGEIKAKKKTSGGKFAMSQFFWAKYFETKQLPYKKMALKVAKHGKIDIPSRKYFTKTIALFDSKYKNKFLQNKAAALLKLWKDTE